MEIIYKDEKDFTKENIIELFLSVDWQLSASNPDKLYTFLHFIIVGNVIVFIIAFCTCFFNSLSHFCFFVQVIVQSFVDLIK